MRAPPEVQGLGLGLLAWDAALGLAVFMGPVAGTPPTRRPPRTPRLLRDLATQERCVKKQRECGGPEDLLLNGGEVQIGLKYVNPHFCCLFPPCYQLTF